MEGLQVRVCVESSLHLLLIINFMYVKNLCCITQDFDSSLLESIDN
jgi:hypothetical protein